MPSYIPLLLLFLACPLMMLMMMRGHGHGHGGSADEESRHADGGHTHSEPPTVKSVEALYRERDAIDRELAERDGRTRRSAERR